MVAMSFRLSLALKAHIVSVHAGTDHGVGLEGSPGVAHGHDLDVPGLPQLPK